MIISKELQEAMILLDNIEDRFNNNQRLEINELEKLGLLYLLNKNEEALADPRFEIFWFHHLYLIYARDLTFQSVYYKINPDKKTSEVVHHSDIQAINENEFDQSTSDQVQQFRIDNQLLIRIDDEEVRRDKAFFEKMALQWAAICIDEKATDENIKIIGKETRDTLKKQKIQEYMGGRLDRAEVLDIFTGLLKSYYIFYEASKILETITSERQPTRFKLNGVEVEMNFYSLIHIINRHYGEIISSQAIKSTKTFHNPKIEPQKINLFIADFFEAIREKGLECKIAIPDEPILFRYFNEDYVLYIKEYKYNKSKYVIETLFILDAGNKNASRLVEKIGKSKLVRLRENLSIYITRIEWWRQLLNLLRIRT